MKGPQALFYAWMVRGDILRLALYYVKAEVNIHNNMHDLNLKVTYVQFACVS